ncbi:MAG: aminodeoxychorismate/anthranilate synthase component II [Bacteroidales bacterium]|nr:aminodeoxychorismate/anthranilate synthase component II [Bacteroidales bacterium]
MAHKTRILIIDNNDSFTFNLVQLVEECGIQSYEVAASNRLDPGVVNQFDKVLISPGPGLPTDFPGMCEVIRRFGAEKDILGVCLGHQAIAIEYGGSLIHLPGVKHGTTTRLQIKARDEQLFNRVNNGSQVGLYHSWAVDPATFPDCLEITAISEEQTILALRHKHFRVRGVQFHPESFMTPVGKKILENWIND